MYESGQERLGGVRWAARSLASVPRLPANPVAPRRHLRREASGRLGLARLVAAGGKNGTESHAKGSQGVEEGSSSVSPLCSTNRIHSGQRCPVDPLGAQARKVTAGQTWCG